jgi:hypothetical protein
MWRAVLLLLVVLVLSGCVGQDVSPSNQPPVAKAKDFTVRYGEDIVLDASGSNDPDGSIIGYIWEIDGSTITSTSPVVSYVFGQTREYTTVVEEAVDLSRCSPIKNVGAEASVELIGVSGGSEESLHLSVALNNDQIYDWAGITCIPPVSLEGMDSIEIDTSISDPRDAGKMAVQLYEKGGTEGGVYYVGRIRELNAEGREVRNIPLSMFKHAEWEPVDPNGKLDFDEVNGIGIVIDNDKRFIGEFDLYINNIIINKKVPHKEKIWGYVREADWSAMPFEIEISRMQGRLTVVDNENASSTADFSIEIIPPEGLDSAYEIDPETGEKLLGIYDKSIQKAVIAARAISEDGKITDGEKKIVDYAIEMDKKYDGNFLTDFFREYEKKGDRVIRWVEEGHDPKYFMFKNGSFSIDKPKIKIDGDLKDWKALGIEPLATDVIGDAEKPYEDIKSLYFDFDDKYIYAAIEVKGEIPEPPKYPPPYFLKVGNKVFGSTLTLARKDGVDRLDYSRWIIYNNQFYPALGMDVVVNSNIVEMKIDKEIVPSAVNGIIAYISGGGEVLDRVNIKKDFVFSKGRKQLQINVDGQIDDFVSLGVAPLKTENEDVYFAMDDEYLYAAIKTNQTGSLLYDFEIRDISTPNDRYYMNWRGSYSVQIHSDGRYFTRGHISLKDFDYEPENFKISTGDGIIEIGIPKKELHIPSEVYVTLMKMQRNYFTTILLAKIGKTISGGT